MEHGEVTPTLKLRRRAVIEHFAAEVEDLYA
jgi:long-subunit acyl-CoA synthetase (AMP-forming)